MGDRGSRPTQAEKAERFRALHEGEAFVMPNPWDAGSARTLEGLGFEALATTSEATRRLDFPFMLTARAENFFRGNPDLDDTIARLQAFERAGADVLYAPRLPDVEQIRDHGDFSDLRVSRRAEEWLEG